MGKEVQREQFEKWEVVKIVKGEYKGNTYRVEGYWDELTGVSWADYNLGNPAILQYATRQILDNNLKSFGLCDRVLYGKIGEFGHLIHISEIEKIN